MSEKNTAPETAEKTENVRVSFTVPAELYAKLYDGDRWNRRMEKGEYGNFVFNEYAKNLDGASVK